MGCKVTGNRVAGSHEKVHGSLRKMFDNVQLCCPRSAGHCNCFNWQFTAGIGESPNDLIFQRPKIRPFQIGGLGGPG